MTVEQLHAVPANIRVTATGRVRPVCEFCGKSTRKTSPGPRVSWWDLPRGWSVAPFSPGFVHEDGSTGDLFTCAACNHRFDRGDRLRGDPNRR